MDDKKYCKDCVTYKRPKCLRYDKFIARKQTCEYQIPKMKDGK